MKLDNLRLYLQIIEKGSMAAAGRELDLSATTVSDRLNALEAHYGVTLINRTTRTLSITEEGRVLAEGARNLLSDADDLDSRVRLGAQTLSGLIRVSATVDLGRSTIEPIVSQFLKDHPQTSVELILNDGRVNIIDDGIDVAIRFGNLADSSLRSRTLGEHQRVICASPEYLKKAGTPLTPDDLQRHNCLLMRFGSRLDNVWKLQHDDAELLTSVRGNRISNDGRLVRDWCIAGYGLALKSLLDVKSDIESGKLVRLLHEYSPKATQVQMVLPPNRNQPLRVKAFSDKLVEAFQR